MDQLLEIWLPVKDYEGLYEVSSLGRVKSLQPWRGSTERVLKPATDTYGYLKVNLYKDGKMKTHFVHRLVAQTFIPNLLKLPEINHLDENPLNNRVENLEWCDRKYNINYGTRTEKAAKSKSKIVLQFTRDGQLVREWPSTHEAQRQGGFQHGSISSCCLGKLNTHKGYLWKYKEQP